jgi:hypothetical protein
MESNESGARNNGQRRTRPDVTPGGDMSVGQRVDRINDTAQEAWTKTRDAVKDLKDTLDVDGRVDRHPYGTLAAAVGIGYVLGGGLFSPLTARIVGLGIRMGLRLAAVPFLQRELLGIAAALGNGDDMDEPLAHGGSDEPPK